MEIAERVKEICTKLEVPYVFKGSFKKANRSRLDSFTGIGDEKALRILEKVKNELQGNSIQYYLDLWDEVRQKSLAGLKAKDDSWFLSPIDDGINHQYVWYHVMEHCANHMGQISTIKNRLPK